MVKRVIYGCLKFALLFYKKLVGDLRNHGFKINLYDPCVANKMVNDKQLMVIYRVDNLQVSHINQQVVTDFINCLEGKYGKLRITRWEVHDYLEMALYFLMPGKCRSKL